MKAAVTVAELAEWCKSNDTDLSEDAAECSFFFFFTCIFDFLYFMLVGALLK